MIFSSSTRRRRGISPVLATTLLIAITLVSAVAVGGFVFGLMGTFTSGDAFSNYPGLGVDGSTTTSTTVTTSTGGSVTVTPTSCTASGKTKVKCALEISNSGTTSAVVSQNSCVLFISGAPLGGTNPSKTIKAGKSATLTCTVLAQEPAKGSPATGFIPVNGGPTVSFSGIWG